MTAQVAWTPLWAAPEVFRQERATVKADIWSYGIVIFELVRMPIIVLMACVLPVRRAPDVRACSCGSCSVP